MRTSCVNGPQGETRREWRKMRWDRRPTASATVAHLLTMSFTLCLPLNSGSLPGAISGMTTVALLGVGRMEIGQKFDFFPSAFLRIL